MATNGPSLNGGGVEYINSTNYKTLGNRLDNLKSILDDNVDRLSAMRKLRFAEVDIEAEREAGRIQPDEVYIPQHIIDTNIRQEQSPYVQYITESPRAVICKDRMDASVDLSLLEGDLTEKLRFDGWQLGMYSNIDAFQANGYSVMETIQDLNNPGEIGREMVQYGDFAFINDTRNLQNVEMCARSYYYTKTQLVDLATMKQGQKPEDVWNREQVEKITSGEPSETTSNADNLTETKDRSLYRVQKILFRVAGVVQVGWSCIGTNDDWLRAPRPLFLGRRQMVPEHPLKKAVRGMTGAPPPSQPQYETEYPYFLYPYLISENDTIAELKGRVYLDQDTQEAVSSLMSATVTQARRAAGMYFSKETTDPNDDVLMQKNIYFRQNCLINANVKAFKIDAPDPGIFAAIQTIVTAKQAETSQVAFAVNNRKDTRKTAKELTLASDNQKQLSTVQVVLFSIALKQQYTYESSIIKSRVLAGLIQVAPNIAPLYARDFTVKPSGDTDVMEKKQLIDMMMTAWPVVETTAVAPLFLADLLEKMFPNAAPKYVKALNDAAAQQSSTQAQQQQQIMGIMMQTAKGIQDLAKHPEYFSDTGRIHAYPIVEQASQQFDQMEKQMKQQQPAQGQGQK